MKNDKKKKSLYSIYSTLFIGICLVPVALIPFSNSDGTAENRALTEMPSVKTEDGKINFEYFSQFENFFSEHFAFRQNFVTVDGKLKAEFFDTSANDDVIVGKDDWLYYAYTTDDYMNISTLSDRAINNIHHNISMLSDYCLANDAFFIFTVAPNKNSVYPEYMPSRFIKTENTSNLERFNSVYTTHSDEWFKMMISSTIIPDDVKQQVQYFTYCDLKNVLIDAKADSVIPVYHKTDTHWNSRGALVARNALLDIFSEDFDTFSSAPYKAVKSWSGDLAEMVYPSDVPLDYQVEYDIDYTYSYMGRFRGFDDISIQTICEGKDRSLLMYRDSFGEAILPFMAESFGSAEFSRAVPYKTDSIANGTVDTVILEIVERNLGDLQKYAPVMPAPVVDDTTYNAIITEPTVVSQENSITIKCDDSGSYLHIYGELCDEFFKDNSSRIFVTANGVNYEAFNAFEDKLLKRTEEINDNGFSLYIPKESENSTENIDAIKITVLSENGEAVTSDTLTIK